MEVWEPVERAVLERDEYASKRFRILFATTNHLPYIGGAEISTHHLATALLDRGHAVTIATGSTRRSIAGLTDWATSQVRSRCRVHRDSDFGYPTLRSIKPLDALEQRLSEVVPDVVVVTGSDPHFALPALTLSQRFPSILYFRIGASDDFLADDVHADFVVANSRAVVERIRRRGRDADFIPSVFPQGAYRVASSRKKVLFVNPIPKKGVDIAFHLAEARPDIPFVFSMSWRIKSAALRHLRRHARRLGNVEIRPATIDPAVLYRDCRIVLVPSQAPEGWPRIVSEAHINGIPVIASNVEGLVDSVGPGGVLVDPKESTQAWNEALSAVWDDEQAYNELCRRALLYSERPDLSVPNVLERFEFVIARAIERHHDQDPPRVDV